MDNKENTERCTKLQKIGQRIHFQQQKLVDVRFFQTDSAISSH